MIITGGGVDQSRLTGSSGAEKQTLLVPLLHAEPAGVRPVLLPACPGSARVHRLFCTCDVTAALVSELIPAVGGNTEAAQAVTGTKPVEVSSAVFTGTSQPGGVS